MDELCICFYWSISCLRRHGGFNPWCTWRPTWPLEPVRAVGLAPCPVTDHVLALWSLLTIAIGAIALTQASLSGILRQKKSSRLLGDKDDRRRFNPIIMSRQLSPRGSTQTAGAYRRISSLPAKIMSSLYQDVSNLRDWIIGVSDNGWTTYVHSFQWLQHFVTFTNMHKVGRYRLLIIDGHESHISADFQALCTQQEIIALCIPAHSFYMLQLLSIGCFGPLKCVCGDLVSSLARVGTTHVSKQDFLSTFKCAFPSGLSRENIIASFCGAGLVPFDPERVISSINIRLWTLSPPSPT